jgi:hypothetical protein
MMNKPFWVLLIPQVLILYYFVQGFQESPTSTETNDREPAQTECETHIEDYLNYFPSEKTFDALYTGIFLIKVP